MRALSIQQPWAWAILHAGKNVENRTWAPRVHPLSYPMRIAIHASKKIDPDGAEFIKMEFGINVPANLPTGCLVGEIIVVKVVDCNRDRCSLLCNQWCFGPFCWALENPVAYNEPIPCKGQLGLFNVEVPGR